MTSAQLADERPRLTFFFPAFNEEENVERTVELALAEIGPLVDGSLEVLIVDDGSSDRTPELADALAAADPRVRVHHQPNRGYGGALKAGFANARGQLISFSDGDLQFDLREMARLLDRLADAGKPVDAVIGYRIKRRDPFHRIFIAKTYNAIVSVAFGLRVRDIDCAMKLFRRQVFDGLRLDSDGPFLSAELLIKLRARGVRMAQVGVNHYPRAAGTNTGASFTKILRTFRDLAVLRWALWTRRDEVLSGR
ncbi:MAG TPA: glycosyltransferase family 2 protein [Candidatus Limnocylindria bacterium]|jgi:glycosyltransferase involved in cell wall biosynthesis|nr:glycosyltransferase family 2 protein [Candidatus Limnocylindria bacterium]